MSVINGLVSHATLEEVATGRPTAGLEPTSAEQVRDYYASICNHSPFFRWYYQNIFPESWVPHLPPITYSPDEWVAPPTPDTPDWRAKYTSPRKASIPYKRENSYTAAQSVEGPVGKGEQRYDVLNTKNTSTIEFRLFKGTMNPTSVFRYLEFVDAIVRFVASTSATNDGLSYERFVTWLTCDAFNVSRYENLVAFLITAEFYKREAIKRRTLPDIKPGDGDTNLTPKPKIIPDPSARSRPVYELNRLTPTSRASISPREEIQLFAAAISAATPTHWVTIFEESTDDPDEDPEYDSDYDDMQCGCDDCRRIRGEIN